MRDAVNTSEIARASMALAAGRLVAFPTETVYGLGADATSDQAVARVYEAKGRPSFNPLIVHVAESQQALALGIFPRRAEQLAEEFWPGPLTIVVARQPRCPVSLLASAGLQSIALRVPSHPMAQELLRSFGGPVVAPSANRSGRISPTTAQHVRDSLGDRVDVVVDGGTSAVGVESTIVGFTGPRPTLLRPGGIARGDLEWVLGEPLAAPELTDKPHSPGQLQSHYSPQASLRLNAQKAMIGEVFLGFGPYGDREPNLSPSGNLVEAAANLFRLLHELDAAGAGRIAVAPIPMIGLGEAINDRLARAAAPREDS